MIISWTPDRVQGAVRLVEILAVDTAAEFSPEKPLHCIYCMGLTLYLLYGVLVLNGFNSELFLHVWDFGESQFDGADPRTPSEYHGDRR